MPRPPSSDAVLITALHELVFGWAPLVRELQRAFDAMGGELANRRDGPPHEHRVIPIELVHECLSDALHPQVRLCRAFLLRRGSRMPGLEVHRNSVQRLVSARGRGTIYAATGDHPETDLVPRSLTSPGEGTPSDVFDHWDVVPPGVWHYPEAFGGEDWGTVAFHSAREAEIVDEYSEL